MKKVLIIAGTRPEVIKLCPLILVLRERAILQTEICLTGQHRDMADAVFCDFSLSPDWRLHVMREGQSLASLSACLIEGIEAVLEKSKPDMALVHGDTATAAAAAMCCFYKKIPIGHVEAGLRTFDMYAPYPEEYHRRMIALTATLHFAPTDTAKEQLLKEGISPSRITVTGNTALDTLRHTVRPTFSHPVLNWAKGRRLLLLTAHRRENCERGLLPIFRAVRCICEEFPDVCVFFPLHKNPTVREAAHSAFDGCPSILLTEPPNAQDFHNIMARVHLILTDSGGMQEEGASLHVPVLVLRNKTERQEGVLSGALCLAGTDESSIVAHCRRLLTNESDYSKIKDAPCPFGDGHASEKIARALEAYFEKKA